MVNKKKSTLLSGMRQKTHKSVDRIMDKAENVAESGKQEVTQLKEKATTFRETVDDYIRKNPEQSVLIAAGIGAVVGAMLAATMMRRKD